MEDKIDYKKMLKSELIKHNKRLNSVNSELKNRISELNNMVNDLLKLQATQIETTNSLSKFISGVL